MFTVREGSAADVASIVDIQRRAFSRLARQLDLDPSILPPVIESTADVLRLIDEGARVFIAFNDEGCPIGSVRTVTKGDTVDIGRLAVDDGWERKGVGSALLDHVESAHPEARRLMLFTGADAQAPLALYRKLGYREVRRSAPRGVELVWLEKAVS